MNLFMATFEQKPLSSVTHPPSCFFRYEDTFATYPHGPQKLQEFLGHLNSLNEKIKFIIKT